MKDCTATCYGPGDGWYDYEQYYYISTLTLVGIVLIASMWCLGLCLQQLDYGRACFTSLLRVLDRRSQPPVDVAFKTKVQQMHRQKRLERMHVYFRMGLWGCPVILLVLAGICFLSLAVDSSYIRGAFVEAPLGECLLMVLGIMFFNSCPGCITLATTDLLLGIIFVLVGFHSPLVRSNFGYVSMSRSAIFVQFVVAVSLSDVRRVMLPNLVNFVFQIVVIATMPALHMELWVHLCVVIGSTLMVWLVSNHTTQWMLSEAEALVLAKESALSQATATSMLSIMTDAVVNLDTNLTMREPSPKLNHLLMRGSPIEDAAVPFTRYLDEADQEKFKDFIKQDADPGQNRPLGQARALPVHLLDSIGNLVAVDLYHAAVLDYDGEVNHLIGISERNIGVDYFPPVSQPRPIGQPENESNSEEMSSRPSNSDTPLSSWGTGGPQGARLVLKAKLLWKVVEESECSRQLFGFTTEAMGFAERFQDPEPLRWLESLLRSSNITQARSSIVYGQVSFYNPGTSCNYFAIMKARVEEFEDSESSGGANVIVHLEPPGTRRSHEYEHRRRRRIRSNVRSILTNPKSVTL